MNTFDSIFGGFDRTIPSDDIGFEILNHYNRMVRLIKKTTHVELIQFFMEKLEDNSKGKKISRRILENTIRKVYLKVDKHSQSLMFIQFILPSLNPNKIADVQGKNLSIWWLSTSKGILYFTHAKGGGNYFLLLPSHFFDRLTTRTEDPMSRHVAIGKFFWKMMVQEDLKFFLTKDYEVTVFFKEGAGLGHIRVLSKKDLPVEDTLSILYLKTFISRDMFSQSQIRMEKESSSLAPMNLASKEVDYWD